MSTDGTTGAVLAYFRHELKAVLAYLTINVLGTLVMLLGIAVPSLTDSGRAKAAAPSRFE